MPNVILCVLCTLSSLSFATALEYKDNYLHFMGKKNEEQGSLPQINTALKLTPKC